MYQEYRYTSCGSQHAFPLHWSTWIRIKKSNHLLRRVVASLHVHKFTIIILAIPEARDPRGTKTRWPSHAWQKWTIMVFLWQIHERNIRFPFYFFVGLVMAVAFFKFRACTCLVQKWVNGRAEVLLAPCRRHQCEYGKWKMSTSTDCTV